jgi:hypothetical protein
MGCADRVAQVGRLPKNPMGGTMETAPWIFLATRERFGRQSVPSPRHLLRQAAEIIALDRRWQRRTREHFTPLHQAGAPPKRIGVYQIPSFIVNAIRNHPSLGATLSTASMLDQNINQLMGIAAALVREKICLISTQMRFVFRGAHLNVFRVYFL